MKNITLKIVSILAIIISLVACSDDFLDMKPQGTLSEDVLGTERGADALLIGCYSVLDGYIKTNVADGPDGLRGSASPTNWLFGEVFSDNAYKGDGLAAWTYMISLETYNVETTNQQLLWSWTIYYEGVIRANSAIKAARLLRDENATTTQIKKSKQIEAEARFLRAFYHFQLRKRFVKIPYITEDVDPAKVDNSKEVWDLIEDDFRWGITNEMYEKPSDVGRVSRWAAKAMLGRVHLYQKEYTEAGLLFDDIIENGPFSLTDHFFDNFNEETEHNQESILEVEYSVNDGATGENGRMDMVVVMPNMGIHAGYDYFRPSFDLFNAFKVDDDGLPMFDTYADNILTEADTFASSTVFYPTDHLLDPRVDWTIGRRGIPYLDWGPHTGTTILSPYMTMLGQLIYGPFHQKKHAYHYRNQSQLAQSMSWVYGNHANNFRLIRLGHVMLWNAEVAAETNDLDKALRLVNEIRERASDDILMGYVSDTVFDVPSPNDYRIDSTRPAANYKLGLYTSFPNQEFAIQAVRWETRLETALEGFRFFDLVRWGIHDEVIPKWIEQEKKLISEGHRPEAPDFGTYVKGKHDHWPIPQTQIDLSNGVLMQNDNY